MRAPILFPPDELEALDEWQHQNRLKNAQQSVTRGGKARCRKQVGCAKMRIAIAALVSWAVAVGVARAEDKAGNFVIFGPGSASCGKWTSDRARAGGVTEMAFVLGFISAYNQYEWPAKNVADGTDSDGLFGWIDNYCRDNPLDSVVTATQHLVGYLATHSTTMAPVRPK